METHERGFKCADCGYVFGKKSNLERHIHSICPTKREKVTPEKTRNNLFECEVCGKIYSKRTTLHQHLKAHERVFKCIECGRDFGRKEHLIRHTHSGCPANREKAVTSEPRPSTSTRLQLPRVTSFPCDKCPKSFATEGRLNNHTLRSHADVQRRAFFKCTVCEKEYSSRIALRRHLKIHDSVIKCEQCGRVFDRKSNLNRHVLFRCPVTTRRIAHLSSTQVDCQQQSAPQPSTSNNAPSSSQQQTTGDDEEFRQTETAFGSRLRTYELKKKFSSKLTLPLFLTMTFDRVVSLLENMLKQYEAVKINVVVDCEFTNIHGETCKKNFKTMNAPLFQSSDIAQFCSDMFDKLLREEEECVMKGSGWTFLKVTKFEIRVNKYNPLRGAGYIPLPKYFRGVVNTRNTGTQCFKYSVLAKFVQGDATHPGNFPRELADNYDWTCIQFPVGLKDVSKFEKVNNISINVYSLDDNNKIYPLKVCDRVLDDHRDLLLLCNKEKETHYVCIKDFSALVGPQLSKDTRVKYICKRCFSYFINCPNKLGLTGAERLIEHERFCMSKEPLRLDLSCEPAITFKSPQRSQRVRFSVYADFEAILKPVNPNNAPNDGDEIQTHIHIPHSYCYLIKDSMTDSTTIRKYRGPDAAKHFVDALKADALQIGDALYKDRQMKPKLTATQEALFQSATLCHICGKGFTDQDIKVRDHMHSAPFTFRGAAHSSCNLKHQEQSMINVYFHNLPYDSHFIVNELGFDDNEIAVIPQSEEKYISFIKYIRYKGANKGFLKLRFVDTLRFLSSSLATLASNLPKDSFKELKKQFPDTEKFNLLTRKGVFPYSYIDSMEKLLEPQLPPKNAFYNKLKLEEISSDDYDHAQHVWRTFGTKDLGEYSDLYLLTDVLLLADIFESFRDTSLQTHGLDPAYYVTLPSFAWDCMLKRTNVSLETLHDFDMHLFFENGIRGGISQCCTRRSQANNKDCAGYDSTLPSTYITYLDANNLYGWAMSQYLPTGGFRWLDRVEIESLDVQALSDQDDVGYVLEVDVEYPKALHTIHNDLPFLCERKVPPGSKHAKLLTTLSDKKNYIVHYRVLKQALNHGMRLKKIHRVVRFNQSPWLKPYIDLNTDLRKQAKNDFEKDLFKLFNNSVFGKFMENLRKRMNFKLVCNDRKLEKLVSRPNFLSRTIFSERLAGIHLSKTSIVIEKPIYVGMCILDMSKELMYSFYYDVLHKHYQPENVKLLYTDTDSFILELATEDLHISMVPILEHLDTSGYPRDNPAYFPGNAKVLGKMKDEVNGLFIREFLGIRSKMYCVVDQDGNSIKRCKGVSKPVVAKQLTPDHYRRCITDFQEWYTLNTRFKSFRHKVMTVCENKLSLSPWDDKRHLLLDGYRTFAHGHYLIRESEEDE